MAKYAMYSPEQRFQQQFRQRNYLRPNPDVSVNSMRRNAHDNLQQSKKVFMLGAGVLGAGLAGTAMRHGKGKALDSVANTLCSMGI